MQYQQDPGYDGKEPYHRYTDVDDRHLHVTGTEQKLVIGGRNDDENVERDDEIEGVNGAEIACAVVRRFAQAIELILKVSTGHDSCPVICATTVLRPAPSMRRPDDRRIRAPLPSPYPRSLRSPPIDDATHERRQQQLRPRFLAGHASAATTTRYDRRAITTAPRPANPVPVPFKAPRCIAPAGRFASVFPLRDVAASLKQAARQSRP